MFNELLRPHLRQLTPYASARDEFSGEASVYLDANENPYAPQQGIAYNRYPDPYQQALKAAIAKLKGVPKEAIFLGNGSDEPIDLLIRAFCEPGKDKILLMPPTYGMYQVSASINNVEVVPVPLLQDFQLNVPAICETIAAVSPKIIFLCSPNNPTGNLLREQDIEAVLSHAKGLVVIDEAYIDFADATSWLSRLAEFDRLVVLQTFSKAWGMAALRLGMAFSQPGLIAILNKIKPPYNINAYTQQYVLQALANKAQVEKQLTLLVASRNQMASYLASLPEVEIVFPSDANFLLVRLQQARDLYQYLLSQGIVVRDRSRVILCEGCLRITVGIEEENNHLLNQIKAWYKASTATCHP